MAAVLCGEIIGRSFGDDANQEARLWPTQKQLRAPIGHGDTPASLGYQLNTDAEREKRNIHNMYIVCK